MQFTSTRVTRPDPCSSSDTASYVTPHLRTKFGECAFSFAGNSLPAELCSVSDSTVFKNKLTTLFNLFNITFNVLMMMMIMMTGAGIGKNFVRLLWDAAVFDFYGACQATRMNLLATSFKCKKLRFQGFGLILHHWYKSRSTKQNRIFLDNQLCLSIENNSEK